MFGIVLAACIVTLYIIWVGRILFAARKDTLVVKRVGTFLKVGLITFSAIAVLVVIMDLYSLGGSQGDVYKKVAEVNEAGGAPDDPYENQNNSSKSDGSLEISVIRPDNVKTTFADVAGQEEAKQEVVEIVDFLKNPEKYEKLGAKIPRGVMLYGPPGTGKTLLARAVAGESGVNFVSVDGSAFDEMYVGVGAARVRELFNVARRYKPCIVFIDEIDALAPSRAEPLNVTGGKLQTINQLLAELDNVQDEKNKDIIVMGATNMLESIDSALLRPGRFDRKVYIRLPNFVERVKILDLYISKIPADKSVNKESLAGQTFNFSGADLRNLVNEAAIYAARNDKTTVSKADFDYAIDKIKLGLQIESATVSDQERLLTAYHEAGHTIVGILSPNYDYRFNKVTVGVRDATLGVTHFESMDDNFSVSRAFLEDNIAMIMGGRVAEEMLVGTKHVTTGASNDLKVATQLAENMVTHWGVSDLGEYIAFGALRAPPSDNINNEVDRILKKGYEQAQSILSQNRDKLDRLAAALMKKETLDRDEVLKILNLKAEVQVKPKPNIKP